MSNYVQRLVDLLPKNREFVGVIQNANHPNYKVLVSDKTGLVLCTSVQPLKHGERVVVQGTEIKRLAVGETVIKVEV